MNAASVDSAVQADGNCNALQSAVFSDTQRCVQHPAAHHSKHKV